jgi:formate C-acetyltransferase
MNTLDEMFLSERVMDLRRAVSNGEHKKYRIKTAPDAATICDRENLDWAKRSSRLTQLMCEAETPVILPGERIVFTRTIPFVPLYYSKEQWKAIFDGRAMHESGIISNICADWEMALEQGLVARKNVIQERLANGGGTELQTLCDTVTIAVDAVLDLAARYRDEASRLGKNDIAETLALVPAGPANSYRQALQSLRFIHSALWLSGHYHVGLGRFDQYMWKYVEHDVGAGILTWNDVADLTAEFFISLNKDSDLYPGIQQGDNGQSLMLGGVNSGGVLSVNRLTRIILDVTRLIRFIDPKINLRITSDTPRDILLKAAELTKIGLGFPQYSNDEVVIPGLVANGYELEDARNYSVAACWEFVIPGVGMDIVNIGAVSFPYAADVGIKGALSKKASFSLALELCQNDIEKQVARMVEIKKNIILPPAPLYTALMTNQLEKRGDISKGAKYNNLGIHGSGSANAADSLVAVKKLVYDEKRVTPGRLLRALDNNYEGDGELLDLLQNEAPKTGNNDEEVDSLLQKLFMYFAIACARYQPVNERWQRVRPGTGSAMYYIWLARGHEGMIEPRVGATADGRKSGDFFSSSLAPAQGVKVSGPFGILQSFAKLDYERIVNGGPITIELSDSVFRTADSIGKVADLITLFQKLGCQQLQLNTLDVEDLKDAKIHPERHRNLVVRVWGWSGYFCELSEEYQDHIIRRHMLAIA